MSQEEPAAPQDADALAAPTYIAGWYVFSVSISVYNKWMFGDGLGFRFPLFITAFHQCCLFVASGAILYFRPALRPVSDVSFYRLLAMPWRHYLAQIAPCGAASAGDIGLSNLLLPFILLLLYTMLKTLSLIFVLVFGLLFRLERLSWRLVAIVCIMTGLVMMMTHREGAAPAKHERIGILLVLLALCVLGLRWLCTQLLLKRNEYTRHPVQTMFYLLPAMVVLLLATALAFEGWGNFVLLPMWARHGVATTLGLMLAPGALAFMMTLCEFKLLSVAQVLTLAVAGIFKELLTILLGVAIFGDVLSALNCVGLGITVLDILWYNYYRYRELREAAPEAPIELKQL